MHSIRPLPFVLSLALHACAILFFTRLTIEAQKSLSHAAPPIGLTLVPGPQAPSLAVPATTTASPVLPPEAMSEAAPAVKALPMVPAQAATPLDPRLEAVERPESARLAEAPAPPLPASRQDQAALTAPVPEALVPAPAATAASAPAPAATPIPDAVPHAAEAQSPTIFTAPPSPLAPDIFSGDAKLLGVAPLKDVPADRPNTAVETTRPPETAETAPTAPATEPRDPTIFAAPPSPLGPDVSVSDTKPGAVPENDLPADRPNTAADAAQPAQAEGTTPAHSTLSAETVAPQQAPPAPTAAPDVVAAIAPDAAIPTEDGNDAALQRALRFVEDYDDGPCAFMGPVRLADETVEIDGFALSAEPFERFNRGFTEAVGVEPRVSGQKIWSPQCPAIDFLRRPHGPRMWQPTIELDAIAVAPDAPLHGRIRDPGHRPLHLVRVSETGEVEDLSASLVTEENEARFTLFGTAGRPEGRVPQLLVVVAGAAPLPAGPGHTAAEFFAGLAARREPLGFAAKVYLLGR